MNTLPPDLLDFVDPVQEHNPPSPGLGVAAFDGQPSSLARAAGFPSIANPASVPGPTDLPQHMVDFMDPAPEVEGPKLNLPRAGTGIDHDSLVKQKQTPVVRRDALAYLNKFNEGADISGLREAPLTSAFNFVQAAEREGFKPIITSAKRNKANHSFHNIGEAIDVRLFKKGPNGEEITMLPGEEREATARLGKQAGWGSLLDERQYNFGGNGPHFHLAYQNESGLLDHPGHTMLNNRNWKDEGHLDTKAAGVPKSEEGLPAIATAVAQAHGVDPDLLKRMVTQESAWNSKAVSSAGARGLLQVMPDTAKDIAARHHLDIKNLDNDPQMQLTLGAIYIREMLDQFGGNVAQAVGAYNMGPGNMQAHVKSGRTELPYEETRGYVHNILKKGVAYTGTGYYTGSGAGMDAGGGGSSTAGAGDTPPAGSLASTQWNLNHGGGEVHSNESHWQEIRSHLQDSQTRAADWIDNLFGVSTPLSRLETAKQTYRNLWDPANPVNLGNTSHMMLKEFLQDATFGLSNPVAGWLGWGSFVEDAEKIQQARDSLIYSDQDSNAAMRAVSVTGMSIPRLFAAIVSGGFLAKGLKMIPSVGPALDAMGKLAAAPGASSEAALAAAPKFFTGTAMGRFSAPLIEQGVVGGLQMGGFSAADYLWDIQKKGEQFDPMTLASHFITGSVKGAALGTALGFILPATMGIGGTILTRALKGTTQDPSAFGAVIDAVSKMGIIPRTLTSSALGGAFGGMAGAAANLLGIDQAMTGEAATGPFEAMGRGALAGGMLGFGGQAAGSALSKIGINWANAHKVMSKMDDTFLFGHAKEFVGRMGEEARQLFVGDVLKTVQEGQKVTGALAVESAVNGYIGHGTEIVKSKREAATQLEASANKLIAGVKQTEAQIKGYDDHLQAMEKTPQGKQFKQVGNEIDQVKEELSQLVTQLKQTPDDKNLHSEIKTKTEQIAAKEAQFDKDPALSNAYAQYKLLKKSLGDSKKALDEQSTSVLQAADVQTKEATTHRSIAASMEAHFDLLKEKLPGWMEAGGIDKWVQFPEIDLFHLPEGAKREALHTAYVNEMTRQSWEIARNKPGTWQEAEAQMSRRLTADLTRSRMKKQASPLEAVRAEQARLDELRTSQSSKDYIDNAAKDGASVASNIPYALPNDKAVWAEAKVVYRHAAESGLDMAQVDKMTDSLTSRILAGETLTPPKLDPATPSIESAAWAKLAMNYGEEHISFDPAHGTVIKDLREVKKGQFASDRAEIQSQLDVLNKQAKNLRETDVPSLRETVKKVNPDTGEVTYVSQLMDKPDSPWAAGTKNYNSMSANPKELLKKSKNRAEALAAEVRKSGLMDNRFLAPLDAAVAAKVPFSSRSQLRGFLADEMGIKGTELSKTVTMFQDAMSIAEIRRIDKMAEIGDLQAKGGKDFDRVILNSLRMKYVNEIPDTVNPKLTNPLQYIMGEKDLQSFANLDLRTANTITDAFMDASRKPMPHESVFGFAMRMAQEVLHIRPRAFAALKENVLKPHFEELYAPLKENFAELRDPEGLKKFDRKLASALEDPSKMREFRKEYEHGGHIDPLLDFTYRAQAMIEKIKATDPHLATFALSSYTLHKFQRSGTHLAAMSDGKSVAMSSKLMSELTRKYDTLDKVEKAVGETERELRTKGIDPDEFLNMSPTDRAMRLFRAEDTSDSAVTSWDKTNSETRRKYEELGQQKAGRLMLKDPLVSPLDVIHNQLTSIMKASGMRTLTTGLSSVRVPINEKTGDFRPVLTKLGTERAAPRIYDKDGKMTGTYTLLSEVPGLAGTHVMLQGETEATSASQIAIHPGVRKLMIDYLGDTKEKGEMGKFGTTWHQVLGLFKQNMLMGTIIPHGKDLLMSMGSDAMNTPWKMANAAAYGAEMANMPDMHPAALKLQAIRSGVNMKTLERGMYALTDSMMNDFGPEHSKHLFGAGTLNNFLASCDASNPNRAQARAQLGKVGGALSDLIGGPQAVDHALNQYGLFQMVEDHQIAGHYMRVVDLLKYDKDIRAIEDPAQRMKVAQEVAADTTNRFAGAMPLAGASNFVKSKVFALGMTPQWFMSKAYTIVDAMDATTSLIGKGITSRIGKGEFKTEKGLIEWATGREAFAQYPPEVRDLVKTRLAKVVGGMLVSSFLATNAMQYMLNGTWTVDNPPDKWGHIHHNGTYYSSFFNQGFVKNIINVATGTMKDIHGTEDLHAYDLMANFSGALGKQISAQAIADFPMMALNISKAMGEQKGVPLSQHAMELFDAAAKNSLPLGEVYGAGRDANITEMIGLRSAEILGGGGVGLSKTEKEARMLTANQYLLRQLGVWDSKDQIERNLRGEVQARVRDINHEHMSDIQVLLDKAKASTGEDRTRYIQQAYITWSKGVHVKDAELAKLHPGGIYRMSDKAFQGMLTTAFNPTVAALHGASGPARLEMFHELGQIRSREQ